MLCTNAAFFLRCCIFKNILSNSPLSHFQLSFLEKLSLQLQLSVDGNYFVWKRQPIGGKESHYRAVRHGRHGQCILVLLKGSWYLYYSTSGVHRLHTGGDVLCRTMKFINQRQVQKQVECRGRARWKIMIWGVRMNHSLHLCPHKLVFKILQISEI